MVTIVSTVVSLSIIFGCKVNASELLLRVRNGTGISFLALWNCHGYRIYESKIYRSGLIDLPFTSRCPKFIDVNFINNASVKFNMRYSEPFSSNSILDWIVKEPIFVKHSTYGLILDTIQLNITENEDVIFKASNSSESRQNLYFAVHYPKALTTGYPKYYVTKTGQSVFGNIPGDENLFEEYRILKIWGVYDLICNLTDNGQLISEAEITEVIKNAQNSDDMKKCETSNRRGTFYKRSENGHPVRANAITVWSITARNLISCAMSCNEAQHVCKSFFFTHETKECKGLSHLDNSSDKPANAIHYVPKNDKCN